MTAPQPDPTSDALIRRLEAVEADRTKYARAYVKAVTRELAALDRLAAAEKALREIADGEFPLINIAWHLRDVARDYFEGRADV